MKSKLLSISFYLPLFLLGIMLAFSTCKKEEEIEQAVGNSTPGLYEILLAGESSALWTVTYETSEHREGYIVNGIKTYTDTTAPTEIDASGTQQYRFYDSYTWTYIDEEDEDEEGILDGLETTYEIINNDRIELEARYGSELIFWLQWDITSKTDSRIEIIYDDFFPGDNPDDNDTIWFNCDQGFYILERL